MSDGLLMALLVVLAMAAPLWGWLLAVAVRRLVGADADGGGDA